MFLSMRMRLPGLVDLSLIFILASGSKGQSWDVNVKRHMFVKPGSDVIIPCVFTCPSCHDTDNVQVYWKIPETSHFAIRDKDRNAFVYHTNDTWVLERYRGKTSIVGNKDKGNCSLMIREVDRDEKSLYLRVVAKDNRYSFYSKSVSITLLDEPTSKTPASAGTAAPAGTPTSSGLLPYPQSLLYMVIIATAGALLIAAFVIGVILVVKYKRRNSSGHSEGFHRPTAIDESRGSKLPEEKRIDEPVYVNMEANLYQMQPRMDHEENIYANVS